MFAFYAITKEQIMMSGTKVSLFSKGVIILDDDTFLIYFIKILLKKFRKIVIGPKFENLEKHSGQRGMIPPPIPQ